MFSDTIAVSAGPIVSVYLSPFYVPTPRSAAVQSSDALCQVSPIENFMQDRITIRMSADLMERLDQWIATQAGFVSRQEAMRQLVASALDQQRPQKAP